jgi:hypothetical protein
MILIIIFFFALILSFIMLNYRAWEIKEKKIEKPSPDLKIIPEIYFRQIEKIMLYLAKHTIQWVVLTIIRFYFIAVNKIKKIIQKKLPKIYNIFKKKTRINGKKISSVYRALIELKTKIKKIKEKTKKENIDSN